MRTLYISPPESHSKTRFSLIPRIRSLWSEDAEYVVRDAKGEQRFRSSQSET